MVTLLEISTRIPREFRLFIWDRAVADSTPVPGRNYVRPPPPPPFLAIRHFSGEGVYVSCVGPHGRTRIGPPLLHSPRPRGVFSGVGGVGGVQNLVPAQNSLLTLFLFWELNFSFYGKSYNLLWEYSY